MADQKTVTLYTDGACSGNPGPGGWAAVLMYGGKEKELSGSEPETTNNRMELLAVICGLGALKKPCRVEVYSDSSYVVDAVSKNWIASWVKKGWKTSAGLPVANRDLWEMLIALMDRHQVTFGKVKGHADDELNNRCDALARRAIRSYLDAVKGRVEA